jgi:hypothetical protein
MLVGRGSSSEKRRTDPAEVRAAQAHDVVAALGLLSEHAALWAVFVVLRLLEQLELFGDVGRAGDAVRVREQLVVAGGAYGFAADVAGLDVLLCVCEEDAGAVVGRAGPLGDGSPVGCLAF